MAVRPVLEGLTAAAHDSSVPSSIQDALSSLPPNYHWDLPASLTHGLQDQMCACCALTIHLFHFSAYAGTLSAAHMATLLALSAVNLASILLFSLRWVLAWRPGGAVLRAAPPLCCRSGLQPCRAGARMLPALPEAALAAPAAATSGTCAFALASTWPCAWAWWRCRRLYCMQRTAQTSRWRLAPAYPCSPGGLFLPAEHLCCLCQLTRDA